MKFLIIGDLHGNKPKIYYKDFDAIIAPGDFCSDELRGYMFKSLKLKLENPNCKIEWYDLIGKRKAKKLIKKSVLDGKKILEYLNTFNVPVYVVPGNWDWMKDKSSNWSFLKQNYYEKIIKKLKNIIDINYKIIDIKKYNMIGYGLSSGPEYPQYKEDKKRLTSKELRKQMKEYKTKLKRLDPLFKKSKKPVIFLSHNIPFNIPLDKITNKESPRYGYHYGSLIAREMINKYQPLVCIGGHMHEHFGKCKIGKTTVINSGFGSKVNVFLEIEDNKIKKLKFYKGKK